MGRITRSRCLVSIKVGGIYERHCPLCLSICKGLTLRSIHSIQGLEYTVEARADE
jgi:hypothetical protein